MTSEDSLPSPDHNSRSVSDDEYDLLVPPYVPNGLIGTPADTDLIFGDSSGRVVKIRASRYALVRGRLWEAASTVASLAIGANSSGSTRFDLIVLRYTRATYNVRATVIAGSPGSGVPSPLNNATYFDMPVANAKVVDGATVINAADVTPMAWFVGPQLIVCESDKLPPHAAGLLVYLTDTGTLQFSTGAAWVVLYEDTGRVDITIASGWSGQLKQVRRINGVTYISLQMTRTAGLIAANTPTNVASIPAGHRPDMQMDLTAVNLHNASVLRGLVTTGGTVQLSDYATPISNGDVISYTSTSWPAGS